MRRVQTSATAASGAVAVTGQQLRTAFQATTGTVQAAQGITQTAQALASLNVEAAALGAARSLFEIGKTAKDFRQLSGVVQVVSTDIYGMTQMTTKATSAWGLFGAAWKASPIGVIAAGIGIAASAMALFSSNTEKAAQSTEKLSASVAKLAQRASLDRFLGIGGIGSPRKDQMSAIYESLQNYGTGLLGPDAQGASVSDLQALGFSRTDLIRYLAGKEGNQDALNYLRTGVRDLGPFGRRTGESGAATFDRTMISAVGVRDLLRQRYRDLYGQEQADALLNSQDRTHLGPYDPSVAMSGVPEIMGGPHNSAAVFANTNQRLYQKGNMVEQSQENRLRVATEYLDKMKERMAELVAFGQQFGAALGDGIWQAVRGAQSLRQSLANIFEDFAAQAMRSGFANLFGALSGSFGTTGVQRAQNNLAAVQTDVQTGGLG